MTLPTIRAAAVGHPSLAATIPSVGKSYLLNKGRLTLAKEPRSGGQPYTARGDDRVGNNKVQRI